jgi:hypothetical protein
MKQELTFNNGWIQLHRTIHKHWIWKDANKLKWWIDILLTVNHTDAKILIGNALIECKRGQSINSLETWAKRWGVSKSKVRRFLILLQNDSMIVSESVQKTTRITVCKYESYQGKRNNNETIVNHKRNDSETMATPNNNVEEEKKKKEQELKLYTEQYINHFNSLFNKNYKPIKTIETALKYWLTIYTIDEIKQALTLSTKLDTFEAKICREEPIKLLRQSNKSGGVDYIGNLLNSTPTTNNDILVTDIHKPMNEVTKKYLIDKHNLASDFFEWPMMEKLSHLSRIKLDYQFNPKTANQ